MWQHSIAVGLADEFPAQSSHRLRHLSYSGMSFYIACPWKSVSWPLNHCFTAVPIR